MVLVYATSWLLKFSAAPNGENPIGLNYGEIAMTEVERRMRVDVARLLGLAPEEHDLIRLSGARRSALLPVYEDLADEPPVQPVPSVDTPRPSPPAYRRRIMLRPRDSDD
jgi:hypothetical protein